MGKIRTTASFHVGEELLYFANKHVSSTSPYQVAQLKKKKSCSCGGRSLVMRENFIADKDVMMQAQSSWFVFVFALFSASGKK